MEFRSSIYFGADLFRNKLYPTVIACCQSIRYSKISMLHSEEPTFLFGPFVDCEVFTLQSLKKKFSSSQLPKQPYSRPDKAAYILFLRLPEPLIDVNFPLAGIATANIIKILQKMNPVSFTRLRKSCKSMDQLAESHRKSIGIQLRRININPTRFFYKLNTTIQGTKVTKQIRSVEDKLVSSDEILFEICPTFNDRYLFEMKLSEAVKKLSGFTFEKVIAGENFGINISAPSLMSPQLREEYIDFIRGQCWRTNAVYLNNTEMEILNIIRPTMVNAVHLQALPKSAKTLVSALPLQGEFLNLREIPHWIDDLLVVADYFGPFHCFRDVHYFDLIDNIAKTFYDDKLFISFIQIKRILIFDVKLLEYLNLTGLKETEAAASLLRHCLKKTPFVDSVFHSFYEPEIANICIMSYSKTKWVGTANVILTSRTGRKGLLAARVEPKYSCKSCYQISIYFWKDQLDFLMPTEKYLEKDSDGVILPKILAHEKFIHPWKGFCDIEELW